MSDEAQKDGENKPLTTKFFIADSITKHGTKRNAVVVHKRELTFKDGLLIKLSPSTASEELLLP